MKGANMSNVREKLWIWGHEAGSHNLDLQLDGSLIVNYYNLPFQSRMTPAEAAFYLGVPHVIMFRYANKPAPPYDTYARSFCPLKQVVWSLIGDSSSTLNNNMPETEEVIELARKFPNITGVIMDDMSPERLRIDTLTGVRASLKSLPHPLDIWIVLYL